MESEHKLPSYLGGYVIDENQHQQIKKSKARVYQDLIDRGYSLEADSSMVSGGGLR